MDFLDFIIVAATGYLLGAIPFAVIIARFCGVNIFKVGSGNPGATNVKRSCGKWAGNICFILAAILIALIVWLVVFYSTRYVSLASIAMAISMPVAAAFLYGCPGVHVYLSLAIAAVIIYRHRSNISRLIKGTENRF